MSDTSSSVDGRQVCLLQETDPCLSDFVAFDLDVESIVDWANCTHEEERGRRIQFIDTLPVLVPMLVFNPDHPFSEEIAEWIDLGEPLVENIAGLMGDVRKETIEFLVGKPLSLVSERWVDNELDLVFALDCVPLGNRPQSKQDWEIFAEYHEALLPVAWDASGHMFRDLCCAGYESSKAEMLDLADGELSKLCWIRNYISFFQNWAATVTERFRGVSNVVAFTPRTSREKHNSQTAVEAWVDRFFLNYSAVDIFRQALSWRVEFQDAVAQAQLKSNDPELVQWPVLLRGPFVANNVRVTSVSTIDELLDCGQALKQHVDDYVCSCTLGDYHVVVLHNLHGAHIGTAMISLSGPENGVVFSYVGAHHRPNGEYAYQPEDDVLDALKCWLRRPEQQPWLHALVGFLAPRRERILQKLCALEELNCEAASGVMKRNLKAYEQIVSELSAPNTWP